ncbi:hypothetical protein AB0467_05320 [Streptomyces sp. NPDC052095]|uniref:hypothetical protein n=1 Tax=unclassified Streptomyces TaxID=2593676 RepID=UPI00344D8B1F
MRPVRIATGTAASAVTIAALGLLAAGPSAHAAGADAPRSGPAQAASRTDEDPPGDDSGDGAEELFPLDVLSGRQVPSLLDAVGGGGAFSGFGDASEDGDGSGYGGGGDGRDSDRGGGGRGDSSGRGDHASGHDSGPDGREPSGGRDSSHGDSSHGDSSRGDSGRDSSHGDSGRGDKEDPGRRDDGPGDGRETPGREDAPSGHRPTGPTGHVGTGVGGSVHSDTTQIAAGAGVLAVTAVGGAWLLRRRASGTQRAG